MRKTDPARGKVVLADNRLRQRILAAGEWYVGEPGEQMRQPEVGAETEATDETDGEQVRQPRVEAETEQELRQMPSEDFRSSGRVPTSQRIQCQIQLILTVSTSLPKKATHCKAS